MSEIRYCANPDCRDSDGNRTVIPAERVRRRPTIEACCPACKQAVHRLRKAEQANGARDVTGGRRRRGGERGPDLPYRRTLVGLTEFLAHTDVAALVADGADPAEIAKGLLYEPASPANRKRIDRLRDAHGSSVGAGS